MATFVAAYSNMDRSLLLKLVGRGNYTDFMEKDIRNLKTALEILENTDTEAAFRTEMKKQIFPYGCSGNCYYL